VAIVAGVAVTLWLGGQVLWHLMLAMHGR